MEATDSAAVWTVTVQGIRHRPRATPPPRGGVVGLGIGGTGSLLDQSGNQVYGPAPGYSAADFEDYVLDLVAPTASIAGLHPVVGGVESGAVTVSFDEPVTGFTAAGITATGASVSGFREVAQGRRYAVTVSPDGSPTITVRVAADAARDLAGNGNRAAEASAGEGVADTVSPTVDVFKIQFNVESRITPGPLVVRKPVVDPTQFLIFFSELMKEAPAASFRVTGPDDAITTVRWSMWDESVDRPGNDSFAVITVTGDSLASYDGELRLELAPDHGLQDLQGNPLAGGLPADRPWFVLDNTPPTASVSGLPRVLQTADPFTVTVDFDEPVTGFSAAGITATGAGLSDFEEVTQGLRYTATATPDRSATITVRVAANAARDRAGNGNAAVEATAVLTPGFTVSATEQVVREGAQADYTLKLNSQPPGDVTVTPQSSDGNAVTVSGPLTFTAENWETPQTVTLTAADDEIDNEPARTATITHAIASDHDVGPAPTVGVTVLDDEIAIIVSPTELSLDEAGAASVGTYTIVLGGPLLEGSRVSVTPSWSHPVGAPVATASGGPTFTAKNWNQPQVVNVFAVDDDIDNPGDSRVTTIRHAAGRAYNFLGLPAAVTVTVNDDDARGVTPPTGRIDVLEGRTHDLGTYSVALTSQPTGTVTITPVSSAPAVVAAPTPLTFTAENWDTPQIVAATGVDDDVDNSPGRTATITHTVAGGDYDGVEGPVIEVAEVLDDEISVVASAAALTLEETGSGSYTLTLSEPPSPLAPVTVRPVSSDAGVASVSAPLTFTAENWDTPQTVAVNGVNDDIDNADDRRTARIAHEVEGNFHVGVDLPEVAVTVTDDDVPAVAVSVSGIDLSEGDSEIYTVALATEPAGAVTVTPASSDPAVAAVSEPLTFTAANWNQPRQGDGDRAGGRHRQSGGREHGNDHSRRERPRLRRRGGAGRDRDGDRRRRRRGVDWQQYFRHQHNSLDRARQLR